MGNLTGMAKTAGLFGSLLCAAGVVVFFIGLFIGPKSGVIVGSALMVASLIGFFIEEQGNRKRRAS
jgi:hypothetical protein